jgi:hypothetical protein
MLEHKPDLFYNSAEVLGFAVSEIGGVLYRWAGNDEDTTVRLTDDELAQIQAVVDAQTPVWHLQELRRVRDEKLAETDWVVSRAIDASNDGLGIQLPQVWMDYRQALRDLPANTTDPANPVWPTKP